MAKFDLQRNKKFDFEIVLTTNEFLVSLNGKHHSAFVYRLPLTKVKAIRVEGCVEVHKVDYKKVDIYPIPSQQNVPLTVPMGDEQKKITEEKMVIIILSFLLNETIFILLWKFDRFQPSFVGCWFEKL